METVLTSDFSGGCVGSPRFAASGISMRYWPSALGLVVAMGAAADARAAFDCNHSITGSGTSYSVLFNTPAGFTATESAAASCDVSVPVTVSLPPGVIAVFSADYRGFLDGGSIGSILVHTNGQVAGETVKGEFDGLFFSQYGRFFDSDTSFDSTTLIELLAAGDPASFFVVDSIDYAIAWAIPEDLQISADQLAAARTGAVTHLNGTFGLLNGATQPLGDDDGVALIGGVGSVTLGVNARMSLLDGFSIHGGAAFVDQQSVGASMTGALLGGSLRYLAPGDDVVRPFAEAGLKAAPALSLSFSRTYETSVGTTAATGFTTGAFFGGFIRGGALVAPDANNDIVFSASLAQDGLSTAAYEEKLDGTNLFAASAPAQTGTFTTIKAGVDWTTRPSADLALTFSGALGHTFANNHVATEIAFAGDFTSAPVGESFVEYGVRAGYEINRKTSIGAFVHGVTGAVSGTHLQVGGDARVSF
jgi:hypothetical protein